MDYPLHDCTEHDFTQFYALEDESQTQIKGWESLLGINMRDNFKCLDINAYKELYTKPNYIAKLTLYLVPCDNLPWGPYEVEQECIKDKEK